MVKRDGLAMLDADGNLLPSPFQGAACGQYLEFDGFFLVGGIDGFLEADDGYIYIWGAYKGYNDGTVNDTTQRFISRLYGLNVGVQERAAAPHMRVYPNPTNSTTTVQLEHLPPQAELLVRDALGRAVHEQTVRSTQTQVALHNCTAGLYLLELWSAGARLASERLVVE
ncbi:MAG TPA: T9SS type A sorting domain-containing protein [Flavobacteriales bacterium]|nr:T9SS type A sorting domain-containing protein [Flavobacteriales bacterium]